ncbi:hypothetical protein KM1_146550 [Entamoeba histolytica HM-3:IMSS]|uniref:Uncharacterized protein n=2 Tax=Entamoeba TaxID=5758 RepID=M7WE79_ENTHI|nr:hypothetical protein KM1_146550 [Entamoeba histolytica HM-3:IMSS]
MSDTTKSYGMLAQAERKNKKFFDSADWSEQFSPISFPVDSEFLHTPKLPTHFKTTNSVIVK